MKRRFTFTMDRAGTAEILIQRITARGLSTDRLRSPSGGFIVAAHGEVEGDGSDVAPSVLDGLDATLVADEEVA